MTCMIFGCHGIMIKYTSSVNLLHKPQLGDNNDIMILQNRKTILQLEEILPSLKPTLPSQFSRSSNLR